MLGFAKTLPELDEVSLLLDGVDDELEAAAGGSVAGVDRGVDDAVDDGRREMVGVGWVGLALTCATGLDAMLEVEAAGRGIVTCRLG